MPLPEAAVNELAEAAYTEHYHGYREDSFQRAAFRDLLAKDIARLNLTQGTLLDVGCGNGMFLQAAKEAGFAVRGIDFSSSSAAICQKLGLDVVSGDFLTHDFGQKFDVISMWDVLEHLTRPAAFLQRVRTLLAPHGVLLGKIPGFGSLSVNLSRLSPKVASVMLGAPDHIQYFKPRSLHALFEGSGFRQAPLTDQARLHGTPQGGSLKTRMLREARKAVVALSGDRNLFFVAYPN
jgi:2-polyprenyl-3-methyl-5-hydroxy-6-metoxy-1,4-benzoquinol methylase